jgi:hypothetical protein
MSDMSAVGEISSVTVSETLSSVSPVYRFLVNPSIEEVTVFVKESLSSLSPVPFLDGILNGFTNMISNIWFWVLYNLISPLLVILFVVLFFIGQYFLIKLYIKLFQYIGLNLIKLFNFIIKSSIVKKVVNEFDFN